MQNLPVSWTSACSFGMQYSAHKFFAKMWIPLLLGYKVHVQNTLCALRSYCWNAGYANQSHPLITWLPDKDLALMTAVTDTHIQTSTAFPVCGCATSCFLKYAYLHNSHYTRLQTGRRKHTHTQLIIKAEALLPAAILCCCQRPCEPALQFTQ